MNACSLIGVATSVVSGRAITGHGQLHEGVEVEIRAELVLRVAGVGGLHPMKRRCTTAGIEPIEPDGQFRTMVGVQVRF